MGKRRSRRFSRLNARFFEGARAAAITVCVGDLKIVSDRRAFELS